MVTRGYTSRPIIIQSISQSVGWIIGMRPFEARSAFTERNSRRRETRDHLMLKYVNGVRFEFSYAVGRLEMNCCNMLYYGTCTFSMVADTLAWVLMLTQFLTR